jgi:uncharacterized protein YndB with AHSA1/START domain
MTHAAVVVVELLGDLTDATVFEPRVGGHIYDRATDGSECHWARVLAYQSPDYVVFSWDIGPQGQVETNPDVTSEVEVRKAPTAPGSSWNTAASTATDPAGSRSVRASTAAAAGRCTWPATPPCSSSGADT